MQYEKTVAYNENSFQMVPPLTRPLRLWTPRTEPVNRRVNGEKETRRIRMTVPAFTIKGGFMNGAGGARRMVIAGKIVRYQEC